MNPRGGMAQKAPSRHMAMKAPRGGSEGSAGSMTPPPRQELNTQVPMDMHDHRLGYMHNLSALDGHPGSSSFAPPFYSGVTFLVLFVLRLRLTFDCGIRA